MCMFLCSMAICIAISQGPSKMELQIEGNLQMNSGKLQIIIGIVGTSVKASMTNASYVQSCWSVLHRTKIPKDNS